MSHFYSHFYFEELHLAPSNKRLAYINWMDSHKTGSFFIPWWTYPGRGNGGYLYPFFDYHILPSIVFLQVTNPVLQDGLCSCFLLWTSITSLNRTKVGSCWYKIPNFSAMISPNIDLGRAAQSCSKLIQPAGYNIRFCHWATLLNPSRIANHYIDLGRAAQSCFWLTQPAGYNVWSSYWATIQCKSQF